MKKKFFPPMEERLRDWIKMSLGAFFALCIIGYALGYVKPNIAEGVVDLFADYVVDLGAVDVNNTQLFSILLSNNFTAAFSSMACGVVPFLYFPAFSLGTNALMIGLFAAYYQNTGFGLASYFAGIVPHGIFEMSALCISCACGLWICENLTGRLRKEENTVPFKQSIHDSFAVFFRLVILLLIVAAAIETFVTPIVMEQFL